MPTSQLNGRGSEQNKSVANPPEISVVVCTFRNPQLLQKTLESLARQSLPAESYEIIVVDNNSQDETERIVREMQASVSNLHYIVETKQGLSHARNRGIDESKADLIAYTDDDAEPAPQWLERLVAVFESNADIWVAGGRVVGNWEQPPPSWLDESLHRYLSLSNWGDEPRRLTWPERVIGVNCAFRRCIFDQVGRFDTRLGRKRKLLLGSEDTEIQERVHAQGKIVYYKPDAEVAHFVPTTRMTREYFFSRNFGQGRTFALLDFKDRGRLYLLVHCIRTTLFMAKHLAFTAKQYVTRKYEITLMFPVYASTGYLYQSFRSAVLFLDQSDKT